MLINLLVDCVTLLMSKILVSKIIVKGIQVWQVSIHYVRQNYGGW
ncbi:hypothetical protein ENHAE0001_1200 [Enhydrobacter aerosaccus SK60]|nr:hypothetical protein ENHAE0001_1200 [Enhydrobacter aerosaccus SK60]